MVEPRAPARSPPPLWSGFQRLPGRFAHVLFVAHRGVSYPGRVTVVCGGIEDGGGGGVTPRSLRGALISVYLPVIYQDMSSAGSRDRTRRHMCTHIQDASDGTVSDSLIGEQVGKKDNALTAALACRRSDGQTDRPSDRRQQISRRLDRCTPPRWMCPGRTSDGAPLRRARTAATLRPRPAQTDGGTDALLSEWRLHLSAPRRQGPRQEVMFAPPGTVSVTPPLPSPPLPPFCPPPLL